MREYFEFMGCVLVTVGTVLIIGAAIKLFKDEL